MPNKPVSDESLSPRISLEQWRCLVTVVDSGGYAQAAAVLNKSQSAVTYAVQKIEEVLDLRAFEIRGRKAFLTSTGQMLYRRAQLLLEDAGSMERAARKASRGWEAEIAIAVEIVFPVWLLLDCLARFGQEAPQTRIELLETVIGGTAEAIVSRKVDLALSPTIPDGFSGEPLLMARFIPVAHPDHPLHKLGREITPRDLRKHRHLVVRDSGSQRVRRSSGVEGDMRWTVTNMPTSIGAACLGHGYAWFPADKIRRELAQGLLKALPLRDGAERLLQIYLVFADRDSAGPGTVRLAQLIREGVATMADKAPGAC